MAQSIQAGRFGQSSKPDDAWLAKQEKETILEPELPIIDTHLHLWDRGGWTYLLPELLADLNSGHNIVATVFEECRSMYRATGPVEMRPVGEVEFVAGIAAMSASGGYGPIKVAQGIVGFADLGLGLVLYAIWSARSQAGRRVRVRLAPAGEGRIRIAFVTSESFAAEVKSETIAITHPGKFGQFRQNRDPHGAIHSARPVRS